MLFDSYDILVMCCESGYDAHRCTFGTFGDMLGEQPPSIGARIMVITICVISCSISPILDKSAQKIMLCNSFV